MLALTTSVALSFSSCKKKEITNKVEGIMPQKIELQMRGGHMHGSLFHADATLSQVAFPLKNKALVTLELQADGKSYKPLSNEPIRLIANRVWSSEIVFSDRDNKRLNGYYTANDKKDLFQFFLTAENVRQYTPGQAQEGATLNKSLEMMMSGFVYRDTNPEHLMFGKKNGHHHGDHDHDHGDHDHDHGDHAHAGTLRHDDNEKVELSNANIGFKGYFNNPATQKAENFIGVRESYVAFDLVYHFVRFATPKDKMKGNLHRNAFAWEESFNALTLCSFKIPVRIVTKHPNDKETLNIFFKDIAKEFQLTEEQVHEMWDEARNIPQEERKKEYYSM